jgi:uncharacterized protein YjbJ (UPF0337 family)
MGSACPRHPVITSHSGVPHRELRSREGYTPWKFIQRNPNFHSAVHGRDWITARQTEIKDTQPTKIMNSLEIKGDWNITKGKLKQKWATLTDDDLQFVEGKHDEMLGRIQKRTGETREAVEKAIKDSCDQCCL